VFFRDDDAGWRDDRLLALLDLFDRHETALDVAVIPRALTPELARELRGRAVHQHGLAHVNHEPEGRKCEFGPSRSPEDQRRDIEEGRELLRAQLDVQPFFTPPWNRCTAATGEALAELGFEVLSRESRAERLDVPGLREIPVHVDLARLSPEAAGERLAQAIAAGGPVGVMFHHAEMGAEELERADELLGMPFTARLLRDLA
jgi:hypothetical protein